MNDEEVGRITFSFPYDSPYGKLLASAGEWVFFAQEYANMLRGWLKYGHSFKDADEALEAAQDAYYHLMSGRGLDLDVLP